MFSRFSILMLLVLSQRLFAAAGETCAALLNAPAQFASQFAHYQDLKYLTPLKLIEVKNLDSLVKLKFSSAPHDEEFNNTGPLEIEVRAIVKSDRLSIDDMFISPKLPPEVAWRVVLANILHLRPEIREIHYGFYDDLDGAVLRGVLAEGVEIKDAVKKTAAFSAMKAFGFRLESAKASLLGETYQGEADISIDVKRIGR